MSGLSLLGVNLSGAEYNPAGTRGINFDYTYPSHAEIDYFASKGMTAIRLPILLERVEPLKNGPLNATEVSYIDNVVKYAATKGITVILDPHDYGYAYGAQIGSAALPNSVFANFWGKLAGHFASSSNVIFGLMNEPNDISATQWLGSVNAAIAAIRASGATSQQILVPGTYWDTASSFVSSGNAAIIGKGVIDPSHNYAFEVHQYLDSNSSGTHPDVVSATVGADRLAAVTAWAQATGNKLFLGEFGVSSDALSLQALNNMLGYMQQHSNVWEGGTYWAAGAWLGSYMYSIEPSQGIDKAQMGILDQYDPALSGAASVQLTAVGNQYLLSSSAGTGPSLKVGGVAVKAGQFATMTPFAAGHTVGGYEVVWKVTGGNFDIWTTDSNGNRIADSGVIAGNSNALETAELALHKDLNGDGVIGFSTVTIEASGSTSLVEVGSNYYLESAGTGPSLKYGGTAVTAGQFGAMAPIGAEQTSTGYQVVWKTSGADQYTVWTTDGSGNFVSAAANLSGTSLALESLENTLHQDLNGDGVIGLAVHAGGTLELPSASSASVTFQSPTGTLKLDTPSSFTGEIKGFSGNGTLTGSDQVDLVNFAFNSKIASASTFNSSTGLLVVNNGASTATLDFAGSHTLANFRFASDGHGGTIVYDPPATPGGAGGIVGAAVVNPAAIDTFGAATPTQLQPVLTDTSHHDAIGIDFSTAQWLAHQAAFHLV